MLYVFHVDTGLNDALRYDGCARQLAPTEQRILEFYEGVTKLKECVEQVCKIPVDRQCALILLVQIRIQFFLFSKSVITSPTPPMPSVDNGSEDDLQEKLKECSEMTASLNTVIKRAQLAEHFYELAREEIKICENLVHDQHLQQQGWSAVVANLEDMTTDFKRRCEIFEKGFLEYVSERETYFSFLQYFKEDLKIPVLPILLEIGRPNLEIEESKISEDNAATSQEMESSAKEITLFEWISASENKRGMDQLFEHCSRGLEQYNTETFNVIKQEITELIKHAELPQMKEVKGLGERLFGLETLMREAKKFVQQQCDLAQAFVKNQIRASNLQDQSILPDLCASHVKQLQLIAQNHQHLCDIRRRCTKAKEELSANLHHRLKWVMFVEDRVLEVDQKIVIYYEHLKRLRKNLEVLQQIHVAPAMYLRAVAEVVRRRTFSQSYMLWASELACHLLTIHNEEVTRRKEFHSQFEGHFLVSLFHGMDDLPPSYATQAPSMFDSSLPKITFEDIEKLKNELPELAENLNVPDVSAITNFFLSKSITKKEDEKMEENKAVQEKIVEIVDEVVGANLDSNLLKAAGSEVSVATAHGLPHLKDVDRGCESETDTEEFEKVGQSPLELNFDKQIPSSRPGFREASTNTEVGERSPIPPKKPPRAFHRTSYHSVEDQSPSLQRTLSISSTPSNTESFANLDEIDNLQISRSEHEKLRSLVAQMDELAIATTGDLKSQLNELRTQVLSVKDIAYHDYNTLRGAFTDLLKEASSRDETILNLLSEKTTLEAEKSKTYEELQELQETIVKTENENTERIQRLLEEKEAEKEKYLKEVTDRLNREHKAEIENIRTRFKLMTTERSPSETNLEKSGDFSSLPKDTTLLVQMTENFELDKERAVNEATQKEQQKWQKMLEDKIKQLEDKFDSEKQDLIQDVARKITDEKDKQIDVLREREKNLNLECIKYKNTIQQLTETEAESHDSDLLEKINVLQKEKDILEEELEKIKNEKSVDLTASVAVFEGKADATTSPVKQRNLMSRSEVFPSKSGKLYIDSCKAGDQVLVLWDATHENFKVLQEGAKYMYFLHSESLGVLGLQVQDGKPNKIYCTGEVIDKEFCHARKSENRYKVPKGMKFFRDVTQSCYQPKPALSEAKAMSQSQSVFPAIPETIVEEKDSQPVSPVQLKVRTDVLEKSEQIDECDSFVLAKTDINRPASVEETTFAEDSGIVDNIEMATAALDDTVVAGSY
ncbi:hypothetical protein NQ317_017124 [Molorchus minor]|uniref:RB1-inducible coiled-coil protein 1 n=1 Tax=Molorchus minor TaxID=1323400 RepID=A0ABQ9JH18_9CUCU|nr:hypothetical protein NQ317_017124 [Molorchus minor]